MAKQATTNAMKLKTPKVKRPGVHAKSKSSKNYKKPYSRQG